MAVAPLDPRARDATTLATIVCSRDPLFQSGTVEFPNLTSFSYSSDVMQMGDPFSVTIPDPRGDLLDVDADELAPGASLRLYLANPNVNGGARTLKASGVITEREVTSDEQGTAIKITGADLGWHLIHNDARLWMSLRKVTLQHLALACIHPDQVFPKDRDPGWGFGQMIRNSNTRNRSIKTGLVFTDGERQGFVKQRIAGTPVYVQVQPGQKMADLLVKYARRAGLLVGVTSDGYLQFFLPDYSTTPKQVIHYHRDERRTLNNVQSARRVETLDSLYTHVTVVGENPIFTNVSDGGISQFVPQFKKLYGRAGPHDWPPLPAGIKQPLFERRANIADGEIVDNPNRRARWHQMRGLFDALTVTYQVRGHHQNGAWWESDTMVAVHDDVLGLDGNYYIASAQCQRGEGTGDVTTLTVKLPNLMTEIPLNV